MARACAPWVFLHGLFFGVTYQWFVCNYGWTMTIISDSFPWMAVASVTFAAGQIRRSPAPPFAVLARISSGFEWLSWSLRAGVSRR